MSELWADLWVRLFNRTTRQLNLTDVSLEFVQKSSGVLEELYNMRNGAIHRRKYGCLLTTWRRSSVVELLGGKRV